MICWQQHNKPAYVWVPTVLKSNLFASHFYALHCLHRPFFSSRFYLYCFFVLLCKKDVTQLVTTNLVFPRFYLLHNLRTRGGVLSGRTAAGAVAT